MRPNTHLQIRDLASSRDAADWLAGSTATRRRSGKAPSWRRPRPIPDVGTIHVIPAGRAMAALRARSAARGGLPGMPDTDALFALTEDGTRDDIHPSDQAAYLIALVHYATLYHADPRGLPHRLLRADGTPADAPAPEVAALMQDRSPGTWCSASARPGWRAKRGKADARLACACALLLPVAAWPRGICRRATRRAPLAGHEPDRTARLPAATPVHQRDEERAALDRASHGQWGGFEEDATAPRWARLARAGWPRFRARGRHARWPA